MLGLAFDGPPLVQSAEPARYTAALDALRRRGALYACACSRKELARVASAPHAGEEGPAYPGTCRGAGHPLDDPRVPVAGASSSSPASSRSSTASRGGSRRRRGGGRRLRRAAQRWRIDYQLAVVVDDAAQGVTEVVRGRDLLPSSPRQVLLHRALGFTPPAFAHVPLWLDDAGERLSKRSGPARSLLGAALAQEPPGKVLAGASGAPSACARLGAAPPTRPGWRRASTTRRSQHRP